MSLFLRVLPITIVSSLLTGVACAQNELAKVQAGDDLHEPMAPIGTHSASSPVPQFDPSSFPGQLFWLAIVFALLYLVMSRLVLPKIGNVIDNRAAQIARDLNQAQEDRTLAGALLDVHESRLAETRLTAQAASDLALAESSKTQAAELATQGNRLAGQLQTAEARINASRTAALAELAPAAASATQAVIAKLTGRTTDAARALTEVAKALQARNVA